jgi:hypothetical protein
MHWKLTAVLALSLAWLAVPEARAQDTTPDCCDYNGFYAGVGGAYDFERFPNGGSGNGWEVNARVGYRFLDYLALEGMGVHERDYSGKSGQFAGKKTYIWSGWLNAKVYPFGRLTGFMQPYGLVGGGYQWANIDGAPPTDHTANVWAGRFGAGIDWYLTQHFMVTTDAAYILPQGDSKSLERITVGGALQYRF